MMIFCIGYVCGAWEHLFLSVFIFVMFRLAHAHCVRWQGYIGYYVHVMFYSCISLLFLWFVCA
jgi:hypothetical protein